jgi:hypothetical protein
MAVMVGTENHIDLEVLEAFVDKTPKEVLTGRAALNLKESTYEGGREKNMKTVASFIVNFAFMAYPDKTHLQNTLQAIHLKRFKELGKPAQPNYEHDCVFDLLTVSDFAYTFWQYLNSYDMWMAKRQNTGLKYQCTSRWTSNRKSAAMENRADDDPGVVMYNKCLAWARDLKRLKGTDEYCDLQIMCNSMSCEMGYFKGCGSNDADGNASRENSRNVRMDVSEAPTMDLDELDMIPVVSI